MVDFHRLWPRKNLNYCPEIVDHYISSFLYLLYLLYLFLSSISFYFRGVNHRAQLSDQPGEKFSVNKDGEPRW